MSDPHTPDTATDSGSGSSGSEDGSGSPDDEAGRQSAHSGEAAETVVIEGPPPELIAASGQEQGSITSPAKVMRIGGMVRQLLEEVRTAPLDEASRERLAEVYERSVAELADALSPDLQDELRNLALPFNDDAPSEAELRVAKAQLVGWLEGLFHGIQATLFAQQMAARHQFEQMRQLPHTAPGSEPQPSPGSEDGTPGGVYL